MFSHPSLAHSIQAEPAVWSLEGPRCGNYPASTLRQTPQPSWWFGSGRWCFAVLAAALQRAVTRLWPASAGTRQAAQHVGQSAYAGRSV